LEDTNRCAAGGFPSNPILFGPRRTAGFHTDFKSIEKDFKKCTKKLLDKEI
jgi:hypothetical protein